MQQVLVRQQPRDQQAPHAAEAVQWHRRDRVIHLQPLYQLAAVHVPTWAVGGRLGSGWRVVGGPAPVFRTRGGREAVGHGAAGDGAVGDGAVDDGAVGDGAVGDGAVGDGAVGAPALFSRS